MALNNWSEPEVKRAENSWGQKLHPYSLEMFDFAIKGCKSWLDLGCGFGRFLNYLINYCENQDPFSDPPDYIGYDSSPDMTSRIIERFPSYSGRIFTRSITEPINNPQESILLSAVFVHLPKQDQDKILQNILNVKPRKISFDINSPEENSLLKRPYFERIIKGAEHSFRMTWQSHYVMTAKILSMFSDYSLTTKYYVVNKTRKKVIYLLERN